jgi:hypothetical protein
MTTSTSLRAFLGGALLVAGTGACVDMNDDAGGDVAADKQTFTGAGQVLVLPLDPKPAPTPPAPLATNGTYQLSSTIDVEAQQLLPGTAYEAVQILEGLRDNPAMTLFDLAEESGVPAVGTIRDALPSALESRLYGWINGYVWGVTTGDGTIAHVIDAVLAAAQTDVGYVQLESTLSVNDGIGQHRLDNVTLDVAGRSLSYDVAPLAGVGVALDVPVTATVSADNHLSIGAHTFGFPYGAIAWRALEDQVNARYGTDLRGLLGRQLDCPGMAHEIATTCYWGQCVGHESQLNSICEQGLDYAVAKARAKVESAAVDPIALDAGTATMNDWLLSDNVCSSIDGGVWTARLDIGNGLRSAPATFTGVR